MLMALSAVSLSISLPLKHLGAFEGKNQLLNRGNKSAAYNYSSNNNNVRKGFSPLSIKCFKGQHVLSPEQLKRITTTPTTTITTSNGGVVPSTVVPVPSTDLNVNDFPTDFKFGAGSSALQSEGSLNVDGRGPSTWDSLIADGTAADSYHRYKDDVKALKNMGVDVYRFSISWPRILPDGTVKGGINQKGVDFYNNFINELIANGITPFVTLFHFDLPVALQNKYNGFLGSDIVSDFMSYADVCFKYFGDRVKHWSTINEPQVFGQYLYSIGLPETTIQNPVTDPFIAMHHIILAHATAARHYKDNYQATQKGEIGIAVVSLWLLPHSNTREDLQAAQRGMDFSVGWLLDPFVFGDYNFNMKALVRDALPPFTDAQKALIKGSYDYIGINYYSSRFAYSTPISPYDIYTSFDQYQHSVSTAEDVNGNLVGEQVNAEMYVYPQGLRDILLYMKDQYENPKVYITENGTPDGEGQDPIEDTPRIEFIKVHLRAILEAIKSGANVKGYYHWSMMDQKELGQEGYTTRMGLVRIPYPTVLDAPPSDPSELDRIPKESSKWYNEFLSQRK